MVIKKAIYFCVGLGTVTKGHLPRAALISQVVNSVVFGTTHQTFIKQFVVETLDTCDRES